MIDYANYIYFYVIQKNGDEIYLDNCVRGYIASLANGSVE